MKHAQIQRPVFLALTKGYRTAPTAALQVLSKISPPDLRMELEKDWYKLLHGETINIDGKNLVTSGPGKRNQSLVPSQTQ